MSDIYPDREYDAPTQRTNSVLKFVGIPIAVGLVVACAVGIAVVVDKLPDNVRVTNDSAGNMVCYQRYVNRDIDNVRETGRLAPGERGSLSGGSSCAVFDRSGNYVSCLRVPDQSSPEGVRASDADRTVRAEVCLSPR